MKVEKIEVLGINVKDLDRAMRFFSELFETNSVDFGFGTKAKMIRNPTEHADTVSIAGRRTRIAIDTKGYFELIESTPAAPGEQEGFRNIHFKVPDLEVAKAEMKRRGIRCIADHRVGGVKEAIYHPDDVYGIRLCLIEYDAPSMIEALQQPAK